MRIELENYSVPNMSRVLKIKRSEEANRTKNVIDLRSVITNDCTVVDVLITPTRKLEIISINK